MSKILIENVGQPGRTYAVDAARFSEMRRVVMAVLPGTPPGLTPKELIAGVKPDLDPTVFPGGETAGWWVKAVQLDGEAKGKIARAPKPPVRLWRV